MLRVQYPMDDRIAFDELRRGVPGAAARIVQHNQTLWRIARSILCNDHDAEEVVQEAYLRAFSRFGEFRGESNLDTWLARITINEALRRLERRRESIDLVECADALEADHFSDQVAPPLPNPEKIAARSGIGHLVEHTVDVLPRPYRLVFITRMLEQMGIEHTAVALQIPVTTVKTRLHRANQQLQETLEAAFAAMLEGAFPFGGVRCERLTLVVMARGGRPKLRRRNRWEDAAMAKPFVIEPPFRLQEWVPKGNGCFRGSGLDYVFPELIQPPTASTVTGATGSVPSSPSSETGSLIQLRLPLDGGCRGIHGEGATPHRCLFRRSCRDLLFRQARRSARQNSSPACRSRLAINRAALKC